MQVKKFQKVSRVLAILLKLLAGLSVAMVVIGIFVIFLGNTEAHFLVDTASGFPIFTYFASNITEAEYAKAALIVVPISLFILAYLFFKAGGLFEDLAEGNSPFRYDFSEAVRKIAFLMIAYDLLHPIFYSAVLTFLSENGRYFYFSLSSFFLIGLILYVASGILNYGIQLQELADETI